jgi:chitinase
MSPEISAVDSTIYSYIFFGVKYGGECYAGNQINNGSALVPDSECDQPCDGNPE